MKLSPLIAQINFHCFSFSLILVLLLLNGPVLSQNENLSCYQCVRQADIECEPHELKPCSSSHDRCVTHIMKDKEDGFKISRECGLGPCTFQDLLGLKGRAFDQCDRSKDEYFCIYCCKESGCNKNAAFFSSPSLLCSVFSAFIALWMLFKT